MSSSGWFVSEQVKPDEDIGLHCSMPSLPLLGEESGVDDFSRPPWAWLSFQIDDCAVRELRRRQRVVAISVSAESDAAVEHHVALRVERIGEHEDRRVMGHWVAFAAKRQRRGIP